MKTQTYTITCGQENHRIVLSKRGAITLLDHPAWRDELALMELGATPCSCIYTLRLAQQGLDCRKSPTDDAAFNHVFTNHTISHKPWKNYSFECRDTAHLDPLSTKTLSKKTDIATTLAHLVLLSLFGANNRSLYYDYGNGVIPAIDHDWLETVYLKGFARYKGFFVEQLWQGAGSWHVSLFDGKHVLYRSVQANTPRQALARAKGHRQLPTPNQIRNHMCVQRGWYLREVEVTQ
jgi:hypothetical protein